LKFNSVAPKIDKRLTRKKPDDLIKTLTKNQKTNIRYSCHLEKNQRHNRETVVEGKLPTATLPYFVIKNVDDLFFPVF
jgi:hypothetical protein